MGGWSSKVDPYILRLENPGAVIVSSQPIAKSSSSVKEIERRGSTSVSNVAVVTEDKLKITGDVKAKKTAFKGTAKAVIAINRMSSETFSTANGRTKYSSSFPWLIKDADYERSKLSIDKIDLKRVIGYGLMGIVRIGKLKEGKGYFAVKSIRKDYVRRHHDDRHVTNEREILLKLKGSPFCVNLFGTFQDNKNLYFIMELAAGGELFRRLSKKENFSSETSKFYTIEIFAALEHVHNLGYVYRDLKPENVMLDENGHCKLVDFGFATTPDAEGLCRTNVGTPAYLSPEQLNGKFTNGYTRIVDWWSLGCFVYELMTGLTPFCKNNRESQYAIYLRVLKGKINFPRKIDADSKDLICQLCCPDLSKRLVDPKRIKEHVYFSVVASMWDMVKKLKLVPPFVPRIRDEGDDRHFDEYGNYFQDRIDGATDCSDVFDGF